MQRLTVRSWSLGIEEEPEAELNLMLDEDTIKLVSNRRVSLIMSLLVLRWMVSGMVECIPGIRFYPKDTTLK